MPQQFDETFLKNADVPRSGGQDVSAANAVPGGGKDANGTDSPRVNTQTIQAGTNSTPSSSKDQSGAQHFNDGNV
jgi:hypothetical protein